MDKGKASLNSVRGIYSYKENPMGKPSQVAPMCGPGMNADQRKANMLLQKQQKKEMLRGKSGM